MAGRRVSSKWSPFQAANLVDSAAFVIGTQSVHTINVGVTLLDPDGNALKQSGSVDAYLATVATGLTLATAPDGGVAIGTNGMLITQVTNVAWKAISNSGGRFDVNIINSIGISYYLVIVTPTGSLVVSPVITLV